MRNVKIPYARAPRIEASPVPRTAFQGYAERQLELRRSLKRLFPELEGVTTVIRRTQKGHTLVLTRSVLKLRYTISVSGGHGTEEVVHIEPGIKQVNRDRALQEMVRIINRMNTTNWSPARILSE